LKQRSWAVFVRFRDRMSGNGHAPPPRPAATGPFSAACKWSRSCPRETSMRAFTRVVFVLCAAGALYGQDISRTPDVQPYQSTAPWSRFIRKYEPEDMPHTQFFNSGRLDAL